MSQRVKVGLVSLFGLYNFGNRLQGLAVDRLFTQAGCDVETLVFYRKLGISRVKELMRGALERMARTEWSARRQEFRKFVKRQEIRYIYFPSQISMLSRQYAYFIVGSDQVWHPSADLYHGTRFLEFAAPSQRLTLAPSMGVDMVPSELLQYYADSLSGFRQVTVRESSAQRYLSESISIKSRVLPDPTLGLSSADWDQYSDDAHTPDRPYVLLYFLGKVSSPAIGSIETARLHYGCQVIDISPNSGELQAIGPQHFISLVRHARLVLTDSYHATIFSCLYDIPFRVFRRVENSSTFSRLEELFERLRLHGFDGDRVPITENSGDLATPNCVRTLEEQRNLLRSYITEALGYPDA